MNKKDFIKEVSLKTGDSQVKTKEVLNAILDTITEVVSTGQDVKFAGFGNFVVKTMDERKCRNPQTGETVIVPEHDKLVFRPCTILKNAVK